MKKALTSLNVVLVLILIMGFSNVEKVAAITNTQVSFTANNDQGNGMIDMHMSVSTDGRYVAFISNSSDLVPNDTYNTWDAFVRDTKDNTTTRVSVSNAGVSTNRRINNVIMSGNGRYVLMTTNATNLVSPEQSTDSYSSVYLRDIKLGQTFMIGASSYGAGPGLRIAYNAIGLSEDARFIYYQKYDGPTSGVYVKDRILNTETRIDVDSSGISNGSAYIRGDVSCDGRFVVFESGASNLVANDTNNVGDIFLADRMSGNLLKNITLSGNASSYDSKITCDGNYILFRSNATNLVSNDSNGFDDIFKYDITNDTYELVTLDSSGNQYGDKNISGGIGDGFDISMDGRYVVFSELRYNNNNPGFTRELARTLLRDTTNNTTTVIAGGGGYYTTWPHMTYDGRKIYYAWSQFSNDSLRRLYVAKDYL